MTPALDLSEVMNQQYHREPKGQLRNIAAYWNQTDEVTTWRLLSLDSPCVTVQAPAWCGSNKCVLAGSLKTILHTFLWSLWNRDVVCYGVWRALDHWVFQTRKLVQLLMVPLGAKTKSTFLRTVCHIDSLEKILARRHIHKMQHFLTECFLKNCSCKSGINHQISWPLNVF